MEFIDDHPVVSHQIGFKNRTEISDREAQLVKDDMVVVWLVRSRCLPPSYHPVGRDGDERYRFNVQKVVDAAPLDGEVRAQAIAYLEHGPHQGFVDFGNPRVQPPELLDVKEYAPDAAEQQLAELARYLHELDFLNTELTPVENVRRLVEHLQTPFDGEFQRDFEPVNRDLAAVPAGPGEVQIVGSLYPNGRRPASVDILRQAFGD